MKKLQFTLVILLLVPKIVLGQYRLEIEISDLKSNDGLVMLQLFDKDQKVIGQDKAIIKDKQCLIVFQDLKPGKYACRFFHDENLSGEIETNAHGKPMEGYGISNNALGPFGPSPFKGWLFDLDTNKKIEVKTSY